MTVVCGGIQFLEKVAAAFPAKDTKMVVACASGRRSKVAMAWMVEQGYTNAVENATGWGGWWVPVLAPHSLAQCPFGICTFCCPFR
jgi:rhodanese-related sulfurtransferase